MLKLHIPSSVFQIQLPKPTKQTHRHNAHKKHICELTTLALFMHFGDAEKWETIRNRKWSNSKTYALSIVQWRKQRSTTLSQCFLLRRHMNLMKCSTKNEIKHELHEKCNNMQGPARKMNTKNVHPECVERWGRGKENEIQDYLKMDWTVYFFSLFIFLFCFFLLLVPLYSVCHCFLLFLFVAFFAIAKCLICCEFCSYFSPIAEVSS